jgi:hypothetical protein
VGGERRVLTIKTNQLKRHFFQKKKVTFGDVALARQNEIFVLRFAIETSTGCFFTSALTLPTLYTIVLSILTPTLTTPLISPLTPPFNSPFNSPLLYVIFLLFVSAKIALLSLPVTDSYRILRIRTAPYRFVPILTDRRTLIGYYGNKGAMM